MKICVIGQGSIGNRHIRILQNHFGIDPFIGTRNVSFTGMDVAVICTPTESHIPIAIKYAHTSGALFIEKPLSNSLAGLDELNRIVNIKGLPTYVAYPFRHHEHLACYRRNIKSLTCLSDASDWQGTRALDHVLLELSHELDLAYWKNGGKLSGRKINTHAFYGTLGDVSINLNMNSEYEVREVDLGWWNFKYEATDELYVKQWEWFFENMHYGMMNNIRQARPLLEQILGFIDGKM